MKFTDFIRFDALVPQLETSDRNGVITELVTALIKAGALGKVNPKEITRMVIKRENEASTGMGKGVAVPHVKHPNIKNIVATIGLNSAGIDFASLDQQPVYSVILLISPTEDPDKHLQAMEYIFKQLQNEKFRKFLRQCNKAEQLEDLLREVDEKPPL